MKTRLNIVAGLAGVLLGGVLVTSALGTRNPGVLVSDKDAATVVGGCTGASTVTCAFGVRWWPPAICGGTVVNVDPTNPDFDPDENPAGTAYCGSGCSSTYSANVTDCSS